MLFAVVAALLLGAEPPPPKLAMPGLSVIGHESRYGEFLNEHLAQQLKFEGIDVATSKEISSLLGFERQKQLLGCGDGTSCMAELANALGAEGVLLGDVAKVGGKTQVNLKIISARDGKTLTAFSERVDGEEAVLDSLTRAATQLAAGMATALHRTLQPMNGARAGGSSFSPGWIPLGVGVVTAGVGAALLVLGNADYVKLTGATPAMPLDLSAAQGLREGGALKQTLGGVLLGVGGAAVIGGGLWLLLGRSGPPPVAFAPTREGGFVVFSGVLP
jgi:hypothetical protein